MLKRGLITLLLAALFVGSTIIAAPAQTDEQLAAEGFKRVPAKEFEEANPPPTADPNWEAIARQLLEKAEKGLDGPYPGCQPLGTTVNQIRTAGVAYEVLTGHQRLRAISFLLYSANLETPWELFEVIIGLDPQGAPFVAVGPAGWVCTHLTMGEPTSGIEEQHKNFKAFVGVVKGQRT